MDQSAWAFDNSEKSRFLEWIQKQNLYALMDPFFQFQGATERHVLDIRDTDPLYYDMIAWEKVTYEPPYLVKVNKEYLNWLLDTLSTERWGVFVVSKLDISSLAHHLQKFVIARGPDQNPYFLRFHDASVLEILMKTWSQAERETFMRPVQALGLPSLDDMNTRFLFSNSEAAYASPLQVLPKPEECLLNLRAEQLQACAEAIDRDLGKIIYWHLRNYHARSIQHLERAILEPRIRYAILRARSYNLVSIADIAGFVALMFELAPNFDLHPSFRQVLVDTSLTGEFKMRRLAQTITDNEWNEALRLYDRSFWQTVLKK
jgi:hypothetical protein